MRIEIDETIIETDNIIYFYVKPEIIQNYMCFGRQGYKESLILLFDNNEKVPKEIIIERYSEPYPHPIIPLWEKEMIKLKEILKPVKL